MVLAHAELVPDRRRALSRHWLVRRFCRQNVGCDWGYYRELREKHSFQDVVSTPELAAEITLQPIRCFAMDGAVIFADIDPGPKLDPLTLAGVAQLEGLEVGKVAHVAETIRKVKAEVPGETAVIGFAGAPVTLLAYLLEGGGSKDFMAMRSALRSDPRLAVEATGYGVDWRIPIDDTFNLLEDRAIQGNLDPAVLRSDPETIAAEVEQLLSRTRGRRGHIMNLGHGIDRRTPPENVAAFVEAVRS